MPISSGQGMQLLGDAILNLGVMRRESQNNAYMTDMEVQVSKGATDLLSKLRQAKYTELTKPGGEDLGREQINSWVQTHKDQADLIGQGNPALAQAYKKLIARAEVHADGIYQGIKDEKFIDYDKAGLTEYLRLKGEAFSMTGTYAEEAQIMTDTFQAINSRSGKTLKAEEADIIKNKWAVTVLESKIMAKVRSMPTELALGSVEQSNKFIDDMLDPVKYPFITQGMINHVRENFMSKVFAHMEQANRIEAHQSDRALLTAIKFMNKNPQVFKTPGELQSWIETEAQKPGQEYMKAINAKDLLTAMNVQNNPPPTDYQALIPVMAGNSSWQDKKRQVLELWRAGKIDGRGAESHIARIDSHIEAEKTRNYRDPVQDPMAHPYLHVFSLLASDQMKDPATKMAASAATITFFSQLREGVPMDAAFIRAVKENNLDVSPTALPQLPNKYQHAEPAYSAKMLMEDYQNKVITKAEYEKQIRRLNNIKDLTVFRRALAARIQAAAAEKKNVKTAPQSAAGASSMPLLHEVTGFVLGAEPGVQPGPAENFELYGGF